jgi:2'-5' RNA ligase
MSILYSNSLPKSSTAKTPQKRRLFTAIDIPSTIRVEIESLFQHSENIDWVNIHKTHITVNFLGNIDAEKIPQVLELLEKNVTQQTPVSIKFARIAVINNMVWMTIDDTDGELEKLQSTLSQAFTQAGLQQKPSHPSYQPHVLLARNRGEGELFDTDPIIMAAQSMFKTIPHQTESISLYESLTGEQGVEYVLLGSVRFGGAGEEPKATAGTSDLEDTVI